MHNQTKCKWDSKANNRWVSTLINSSRTKGDSNPCNNNKCKHQLSRSRHQWNQHLGSQWRPHLSIQDLSPNSFLKVRWWQHRSNSQTLMKWTNQNKRKEAEREAIKRKLQFNLHLRLKRKLSMTAHHGKESHLHSSL